MEQIYNKNNTKEKSSFTKSEDRTELMQPQDSTVEQVGTKHKRGGENLKKRGREHPNVAVWRLKPRRRNRAKRKKRKEGGVTTS